MFLASIQRNGLRLVASSAPNKNGGIMETSEREVVPRLYTWTDKKVGLILFHIGQIFSDIHLEHAFIQLRMVNII